MKKMIFVILTLILIGVGFFATSKISNERDASNLSKESTALSNQSNDLNAMYASMKGESFDKAYLTDMIAHHQGALNMASQAKSSTANPNILSIADSIITSQTDEVRQMMQWQQEWGYLGDNSDPHAGHSIEMPSTMSHDMDAMEAALKDLRDNSFDQEFMAQMILHHEQAIAMSRYADKNAEHVELKLLAVQIIEAQQKEVADMKRWQQEQE